MFKKALVLHVINDLEDDISVPVINDIIEKYEIKSADIRPKSFENAIKDFDANIKLRFGLYPGSLLCLSVSPDEKEFIFLAHPMSNLNIQTPIFQGEIIWYFLDETYKQIPATGNFLDIKYFWHSKAYGLDNNENSGFTTISPEELSIFNKNSRINTTMLSGFFQEEKGYYYDNRTVSVSGSSGSLILLDDNESSTKILVGPNREDDYFSTVIDDFASSITIAEKDSFKNYSFFDDNDYLYKNRYKKPDSEFVSLSKPTFFSTESANSESTDFINKVSSVNIQENIANEKENVLYHSPALENPQIVVNSSNIIISSTPKRLFNEEFDDFNEEERNEFLSDLESSNELVITRKSYNEKKSASIHLDYHNDIFIEGKTLYIGNFLSNLKDKNLINEDIQDTLDVEDKSVLQELSGKGDGVLIGYNSEYSEPLVLGNTLITLLKDIITLNRQVIEQNKKLNEELKKITTEFTNATLAFKNHVHPPVPLAPSGVAPITASPQLASTDTSKSSAFTSTEKTNIDDKLDEISKKLDAASNNLKYSLSRFAKTS